MAVYYLVGLGGSYALFWLPYFVSMAIGVLVAYRCAAGGACGWLGGRAVWRFGRW